MINWWRNNYRLDFRLKYRASKKARVATWRVDLAGEDSVWPGGRSLIKQANRAPNPPSLTPSSLRLARALSRNGAVCRLVVPCSSFDLADHLFTSQFLRNMMDTFSFCYVNNWTIEPQKIKNKKGQKGLCSFSDSDEKFRITLDVCAASSVEINDKIVILSNA